MHLSVTVKIDFLSTSDKLYLNWQAHDTKHIMLV